jgi:hypothetical protein
MQLLIHIMFFIVPSSSLYGQSGRGKACSPNPLHLESVKNHIGREEDADKMAMMSNEIEILSEHPDQL